VLIAIELWLETADKEGARGSSAPGKSPPRPSRHQPDGGRLRISAGRTLKYIGLFLIKQLARERLKRMTEETAFEPISKKLPHGGAANIRGEIVWRITREELEEMKGRVMSIFDEDD